MSYLPMGDVSSDSFNSTKYPGICKPSNVSTLATFKRCQTQMNRVASVKGIPTIAVDGDIGPGTVSLFSKIKPDLALHATAIFNVGAAAKITATSASCSAIASIADVIADIADTYADYLKAPTNPPAPKPTKPPVLVDSKTGIEKPAPMGAGLFAAWEASSTTTKVAALAVAGGLVFVALGGKALKRRRRW